MTISQALEYVLTTVTIFLDIIKSINDNLLTSMLRESVYIPLSIVKTDD